MTHTPGPWLITPELGCKDIGPEDVGCPDGIYAIAGTYGITPEAEDKDNAALIAAAPELLEACKCGHDASDGWLWDILTILQNNDRDLAELFRRKMQLEVAAIAKAEERINATSRAS